MPGFSTDQLGDEITTISLHSTGDGALARPTRDRNLVDPMRASVIITCADPDRPLIQAGRDPCVTVSTYK